MANKLIRFFFALTLCLGLMPTSAAFAIEPEDTNEHVLFTEDMAKTAAEDFSEVANPGGRLSAGDPVKFYDLNDNAVGYAVNYFKDGTPAGYVVFDNGDDSLISQYSFSSESASPTDIAGDYAGNEPSLLSRQEDEQIKNYKIGPFSYAAVNAGTGEGATNYGEDITLDKTASLSSKSDSGSWGSSDLWIPYGWNPGNYALGEGNNIGSAISFPEPEIEYLTNKYACAISALLPAVFYYGASANIVSAYNDLWGLSGTYTDHIGSNGITYGVTMNTNIGPALRNYMSIYHGINVNYSFSDNPNYQFYKSMINGGNIGIFCASILVNGSYSGHAVSVQGYQTMLDRNNNVLLETLVVADGWNAGWANLNLKYAGFTNTDGFAFSR